MSTKKASANTGADQERALWMRKVRTLKKYIEQGARVTAIGLCDQLLEFGQGRAERNAAKEGGLGRR